MIHTYDNNYCLNDAVIQCNISTNPKEYIASISDKITHNSQSYVSKDKLCDILLKAKANKAKELLKYLKDSSTTKEKLEIVNLNKKTNQLINFVDYKESTIQFNNKSLKYFLHNDQFYFKAKDVAEILEYSNTAQSIRKLVDDLDKFSLYNLLLNEENKSTNAINTSIGGCYCIAPPSNHQIYGILVDENQNSLFSISNSIEHSNVPLNGTLENNKDKIDPNKLKNISNIYNKIKNEDLQTIFINESGLYSLIMSSKKEEAKIFKRWVTSDVLPSIRKNGTYVSKKLLEYNKDELKGYYNKDCVYILHIKDNIYKYGKTSDIQDRFYRHKQKLEYMNIEKIYVLNSINEINALEDDIKEFTKMNKINIYYNNGIEYFECNTSFTINKIIENIDNIYKKLKKNTNSTDILLGKLLEKLDKLQQQYENIDSRLSKLENNNPQPNTINTTGKCIDCNKETTKFATRCGKCERKNKLKIAMEDGTKPTYDQLQKDLTELRFVSHVAKKYNVTPRTVTKWFANYDKYNMIVKPEIIEEQSVKNIPQQENIKSTPIKDTPNKQAPIPEPIIETPKVQPIDPKKKKCLDCDTQIVLKSTRCLKCMNKNKIKTNSNTMNRPSLEQLKNDLKELKSMVQVGVKYKVSDNAIRKWIKNYEKIV
jgi:prophage antirepressor-like protein/predicted GIY-YIG superfamily endonuclease